MVPILFPPNPLSSANFNRPERILFVKNLVNVFKKYLVTCCTNLKIKLIKTVFTAYKFMQLQTKQLKNVKNKKITFQLNF